VNKQEALEVVLRKMRGWEEPHEEVKAREDRYVYREMTHALDAFSGMAGMNWQTPGAREYLKTIAAAALYMMVDEVEVVEGRTLDEWLASKEDGPARDVAATMVLARSSAEHTITFGPDQISPEAISVMSGGTIVQGDLEKAVKAFGEAGAGFIRGVGGIVAKAAADHPARAPYLPIPLSKDGHPEKEGHTDA
jgi:hypothetical protein